MDALRIYVITWNVATRAPDDNFLDLLNIKQFKNENTLPDFYVIGLQEVKSQPQNFILDAIYNDPWTNAFKTALTPLDYVKVKTIRLVGLLLNVFCLRKHVIHLRDINTQETRTGLKGFWGNKGAVTTRLQIYGCSICLINSHLAPHDHSLKERVDDYNSILQGQKFDVKDTTTIFFHDYVFWFGDLNFRLDNDTYLSSDEIIRRIEKSKIDELFEYDQLKRVMATGEAFSELEESDLTFQPTYKYNINAAGYDSKRRPAWTDRILYRVNKYAYDNITLDLKQISYQSIDRYNLSDHKPVTSEFQIKVFSNYPDKQVKLNLIGSWKCGFDGKFSVSVNTGFHISMWDWIGLYHYNFSSLDDYVHYLYLSPSGNENAASSSYSSENAKCTISTVSTSPMTISSKGEGENCDINKLMVTIPGTVLTAAGSYRLLYFTRNSDSVLGMSDAFHIEENPELKESLDW